MADNYLENKMEEYRAGKRAAAAPRAARGMLDLRLSRARVLVAGDLAPVVEACARAFAAAGARTAAFGCPGRCGTARCYDAACAPADAVAALVHDWLEIDVLVIAGSDVAGVAAAVEAARAAIPEALRGPSFTRINIGFAPARESALAITITDASAQAEDAALLATVLCRHVPAPGSMTVSRP